MRNERRGARVLQLVDQLRLGVAWVRRRDDTAGPKSSEDYARSVDIIWCVDADNVALLQIKVGSQALAKIDGRLLELLIRILPRQVVGRLEQNCGLSNL